MLILFYTYKGFRGNEKKSNLSITDKLDRNKTNYNLNNISFPLIRDLGDFRRKIKSKPIPHGQAWLKLF